MRSIKVVFLFVFFITYSFSQEYIAMLKSFKGEVLVKQGEQSHKITLGQKLFKDDIVITKSDSSADIVFNEGSILSLGEDSFLTINEYIFNPLENDFDFDLTLSKGTAVFQSGKIGKLAPDSFKMNFPKGVVGIRGTKFLLKVD